jgi:hypothetical protein
MADLTYNSHWNIGYCPVDRGSVMSILKVSGSPFSCVYNKCLVSTG